MRSVYPGVDVSLQLATKWKESLAVDGSTVVNAPNFFTRYFLDVIGEGMGPLCLILVDDSVYTSSGIRLSVWGN
jgi:hypothetical protein